jgi:osmotically-inducible protein OsmY
MSVFKIRIISMCRLVISLFASFAVAAPASAQLSDILLGPKTLIDRAIEARSSSDIARDNAIVIDVNKVMAELGTIKASTEIYEQRLLVTGIFSDAKTYKHFETDVRKVNGVKKLYWQVTYMTDKAKEDAITGGRMMDWPDVLVFEAKAQARLIGTAGVADVNFRVTADPYGNLHLLGRARSREELKKAIARLEEGDGVKRIYNYAVVRP